MSLKTNLSYLTLETRRLTWLFKCIRTRMHIRAMHPRHGHSGTVCTGLEKCLGDDRPTTRLSSSWNISNSTDTVAITCPGGCRERAAEGQECKGKHTTATVCQWIEWSVRPVFLSTGT